MDLLHPICKILRDSVDWNWYLDSTWVVPGSWLAFFHFEAFKSHLSFIFCGLSYHLEMLGLGEHKSPTGKGVPTEGLHSEFLEAWWPCCLSHTVRRRGSHHSQSALCCSDEPVKSQTKLTIQCLIKPSSLSLSQRFRRLFLDSYMPLLTESSISLLKKSLFSNTLTFKVIK